MAQLLQKKNSPHLRCLLDTLALRVEVKMAIMYVNKMDKKWKYEEEE